jgi:alkanesulfonate monooxygenase SsuD/methylene tetrahydromethanopterin reductase-like flavin-dependent oxidoreductase (luciferase family)
MTKQLLLGLHLGNGDGSQPGAWRMPGVAPQSDINFDVLAQQAQAAERGKLHFLFLPDGPTVSVPIETQPPGVSPDVMLTLAAIARETKRIGLVATGSTTINEPYNLARQFKDVMSHGRAGWNAVTSSSEGGAAKFGRQLPSSEDRYGRAHKMIQLVQALWGSWG